MLLRSTRSFGLKHFPTPAKYHDPPNNSPQTAVIQDIHLLAYNGCPSAKQLRDHYPNTQTEVLHSAVADLWIDRLAYTSAKTVVTTMNQHAIYHRISSLSGASGGPLINNNGELLGNFLLGLNLINSVGLHSRGEYRPDPSNPTQMIVLPNCNNVGVSLDSPNIRSFLNNVVAPRLSPDVRQRWANF